jgi:hypothetical protein
MDTVVLCPYHCGVILEGIHAAGNMRRHVRMCHEPEKRNDSATYSCPHDTCRTDYTRRCELTRHLYRCHNASRSQAALDKEEERVKDDDNRNEVHED